MVPTIEPTARAARKSIWIADPRREDYDGLKDGDGGPSMDVCFLGSAREVLRRWREALPDVCLVNAELPGMSGFDVVSMLRPFPAGTTVCLVDNRYAVENEVRALGLGVHHYLCKPLEAAVLSACCAGRRARAASGHGWQ